MKNILFTISLLSILVISCTKIVYYNESNIDYEEYQSGYIDFLDYNGYYFDLAEVATLNYFYERVLNKGGFDTLYHYFQNIDTTYQADLTIELNMVYLDGRDFFDNNNGRNTYRVEVSIDCIGRDLNGAEVFNFNTLRERTFNLDEDDRFFTELERDAILDVLKEISEYFLRDFEI